MGEVVALHGPSVAELAGKVADASARNALGELLIVGRDGEGRPVVGASQMTAERALWLADHLLQFVRTL